MFPPSVHAAVLKRTHNNEMAPKGRRANNFTPEHLRDGLLVSYTKCQATVQTVWSVGAPCKCCKVCSMYMFKEVTTTSITPVLHQEGKKKNKKKKRIGCDLLEEPCFIKKKSLFTLANASDAVDKVPLPMHQFPTSFSAKLGGKKLTSGIQYTKLRGAVLWSQVHFSILSPIINQLMWALVQLKKKV